LVARRRALVAAGLAAIFLLSWPPAAWVSAQPLEGWYSKQPPVASNAEAIVVLAAGLIPAENSGREPSLKENTYLRCRYGAWLWSRHKDLPVLLCGGTVSRLETPAATVMRRMMAEEGVPESLLWTEDRSTSTYENAVFGARILREKRIRRILLVTEAYHMLRSERCFRKQGLEVIPAACNFTVVHPVTNGLLPGGEGMLVNEETLHEFFGLGWYLMRGRI
jgi:uncharacterized SAM-binding protein YcdF (DUF218 family)